ncbi:MAG: RNA polymerase sigma factor [Pseudomonadales bacterium]|jgi:RNA polymerase sigma-70 factor (ECF subfamily)
MTSATETKRTIRDWLACPDSELIKRIRQGDINAYEGIMRRYNQRLYRIARSILNNDAAAMDAMQDAYLKAFDQLETLQDIVALPVWLSRIVRNEALQQLRRNQRLVSMPHELLEPVVELNSQMKSRLPPESEVANQQLAALLEQYIDKLPDTYRSVFVLRAVEHCSVRETAEVLDIPEATVKTRYFRANALLQRQLNVLLRESGLGIYEFAGHRCDAVVSRVLQSLT